MNTESLIEKLVAYRESVSDEAYAELGEAIEIVRKHEYPDAGMSAKGELAQAVASAASLVGDKNAAMNGAPQDCSEISDAKKLIASAIRFNFGKYHPATIIAEADEAAQAVIEELELSATKPVLLSPKKINLQFFINAYLRKSKDRERLNRDALKSAFKATGMEYVD